MVRDSYLHRKDSRMLELRQIEKSFGKKKVLRGVNMQFQHGIYGLVGLNGAGKSTLINIITGILDADRGKVLYNGMEISNKKSAYCENLGFMPQYTTFYPEFTAKEFLKYMCVMKGIPKREQEQKIAQMLEQVNLTEYTNEKIGSFSGGMRQRIGIAQAIINEPEILIMDEPTAGLDPSERIRFRHTLTKLASNRTILLATHIIPDIERMADHVLLLHDGNIIVKKQSDELVEELELFFSQGGE